MIIWLKNQNKIRYRFVQLSERRPGHRDGLRPLRDRGPRAENRHGALERAAVRHRWGVPAAVGAQAASVRASDGA